MMPARRAFRCSLVFCAALFVALAFCARAAAAQKLPLETIKLPPGFAISVFADNVPNARAMALGDKGTLFVGSIYRISYRR